MCGALQAQRVLNVVKKEVDRWKRSGSDSELKHKQVCGRWGGCSTGAGACVCRSC